MSAPTELITPAAFAARLGVDVKTARRMLQEMHDQFGPGLVWRRPNGRLVTTDEALSRLMPMMTLAPAERRFKAIDMRLQEIETRQDGSANDIGEIRREIRELSRMLHGMHRKVA